MDGDVGAAARHARPRVSSLRCGPRPSNHRTGLRHNAGMDEIRSRFVAPFYLQCLHGNLVSLNPDEQYQLVQEMRAVAPQVTLDVANALWAADWRSAWMASWWAGVRRWPNAVAAVAPLLIPSRFVYSGQGHCFALSRVADLAAQDLLLRYLDTYLPQTDAYFDQEWAMAALLHVSSVLDTGVPAEVWVGWHSWSRGKYVDVTKRAAILHELHKIADQVGTP